MQDTVASTVQQHPQPKPGYRLAPATVGREDSPQTVWVSCPVWCVTDHAERVTFVEDISHSGRPATLSITTLHPARIPLAVSLSWWPALGSGDDEPKLAVDLDSEVEVYGRTAAMAMADQLVAFAADVRRLAQVLPADAPRRDEADEAGGWESLTRDDIASRPIAFLVKAFGMDVVETDVDTVALYGEPGSMQLHVLPDVPQCLREDLARRALLAWFDARVGGDV